MTLPPAATSKPAGARRPLQSALRAAVSLALIAVLIYIAHRQNVLDSLRSVPPATIAAAGGMVASWLVNSVRWNLLLRVVGITEGSGFLASLYFIGTFFSQILPTGAGGDAVRMLELYRRGHKPAAAVVATLQERLMGMGVSMLVGLIACLIYYQQLPPHYRPILLALPLAAAAGVAVFLYPRLLFSIFGSVPQGGIFHRLLAPLRQAAELPPLTLGRLLPVIAVTLIGDMLSFAVWYLLGRGVGLTVPFGGFCLVVPLVWIISMAPSVGGAGVREAGFVWLMKLFSVPTKPALAVAALYLCVQIAAAAIGGVLLLLRMIAGSWKTRGGGD